MEGGLGNTEYRRRKEKAGEREIVLGKEKTGFVRGKKGRGEETTLTSEI